MKGQYLAAALCLAVIGNALPASAADDVNTQTNDRHVEACTFFENDAQSLPPEHHAHRLREVCHVMALFAEFGMWGPAFERIALAMHDYQAVVQSLESSKPDEAVSPATRHLIARRLGLARMSEVFLERYGEILASVNPEDVTE